ncbi:hypothetical protein, partial [Lysobacter sp. Root690]|uniref:hypothetical protein n=1 Tax=Lysobacter sp. Root690 TaxID=1736588 RepID=UPI001F3B182A
DIHVPVAHGVHPARRPSGVLLLTRVTGFAALDELRGFRLKPKLKLCFNGNGNGNGNGNRNRKHDARSRHAA